MFVIIGYMVYCVIMRYFFHSAINYMAVIPNIFYVYVSFGAAFVYNQHAFINIDLFYRKFTDRKRAAIDLITSGLFFLFTGILFWFALKFALAALPATRFYWGMLIDPARWPPVVLFPIGVFLLLLSGIARFIGNIMLLITPGGAK